MTELESAQEHERAAAAALDGLRAAAAALPTDHPATTLVAEALALAEDYHREAQVARRAAEGDRGRPRPDDYWSARWRT